MMPDVAENTQQYTKLEDRLVLLSWLNDSLGFSNNRDLLANLKETGEGFEASGHSRVYHHLIARGDKVKVSPEDLAQYDINIRLHLQRINAKRLEPITLRYFQYLAAFYAEIFLDRYFHARPELLHSLNSFIAARNAKKLIGDSPDPEIAEADLRKLAFWMATGSGKTLLMHLNYLQFLHYNDQPLDNIILITPNEGLSDQHLEELAASSIPAQRFELDQSGLRLPTTHSIHVIEITKLVEEKRGAGATVPVEAFEGNNLIFVDEGHKGSGGEAWRGFRDALAATGFTFEYSATFGQALTAARNDPLTAEYGNAIAFDYSYKYFHADGYGKDFSVLNLAEQISAQQTETLLMGNLLSFYEQLRVWRRHADPLKPYHLERPLWVFVGSTVNAVYTEDGQKRSDVLTVLAFLHHVLQNRRGWAVKCIKTVLEGKTQLKTEDGRDLFADRFPYLRREGFPPERIYKDILGSVLHTKASGGLHIADLRGAPGEIGLKAAGSDTCFGLVYVGDTAALKKLIEDGDYGIGSEEDPISASLFRGIATSQTSVDVLIGARKFMEGWNSWRVSTMGLLNIGRKEGSQIIQLFGRGVRLHGRDLSLKRSTFLAGPHPDHVELLETLNIFAIRANFMDEFRNYLEREGVETGGEVQLRVPIRSDPAFLQRGLFIPRTPGDQDFTGEAILLLRPDSRVHAHVDLSLKVQVLQAAGPDVAAATAHAGASLRIPSETLELIDWEQVHLELLEHKQIQGYFNLLLPYDAARGIMDADAPSLYTLIAEESVVRPRSFGDRLLLHNAVVSILRNYMDRFYRIHWQSWETDHMIYAPLDQAEPNLNFNSSLTGQVGGTYILKIDRSKAQLIAEVAQLVQNQDLLYRHDTGVLPRIHFDRHIYQPLLKAYSNQIRIAPPGLNEGEAQFVADLQTFWALERNNLLSQCEVFLLRNLSRGTGVGFFKSQGFYPDFILWIVKSNHQHIVFIEPHGMLYAGLHQLDEKAALFHDLSRLASDMQQRYPKLHISLDSYIVSRTPFDELRTRYGDGDWDLAKFATEHILFSAPADGYNYMQRIFTDQIAATNP